MRAVYALYPDGHSAQQAVDGLRAAGLADSQITVITGEPMGDFECGRQGRQNHLWYAASGGGLLGLLFGFWLTQFVERDWPINVGNMSTVAWWPNLIITFELTMLGAILSTVITLIVTNGLCRGQPLLYDPGVTNGKILVGVENPSESSLHDLERALQVSPGIRPTVI